MRIYLFFLLFAAAVWGCGDTPKKGGVERLGFQVYDFRASRRREVARYN